MVNERNGVPIEDSVGDSTAYSGQLHKHEETCLQINKNSLATDDSKDSSSDTG